jgi:hypothetical protein
VCNTVVIHPCQHPNEQVGDSGQEVHKEPRLEVVVEAGHGAADDHTLRRRRGDGEGGMEEEEEPIIYPSLKLTTLACSP